jgi:23S rRNA (uracil1939-C5)-methyltransferase
VTVVVIDRIAAGGDGVGRLEDGRTVFVPRTAPGDAVEIEITTRKARYARGRAVRIISGSPLRVEPECPHYVADNCGGCQLQHLSIDAQLGIKRRIAGDALRRIGGRETEDPRGVPSPQSWRYRTKLTLAVQGETIGLHREDGENASSVFPLIDCRITGERLMELWQRIRANRAKLPADVSSVVLRQDRKGGLHVVAVGGSQPWKGSALAAAIGGETVSVWWKPAGGAARIIAGERTGFPALAFEQANPALAASIREHVVAALGDVSGRVVWDLYGGVGDTARALAARGASVWSVDADRSAIEWAEAQGDVITYIAARAEDALRKLPEPDAIVVNPPRTGLDARVSAYLDRWGKGAASPSKRVAYVSCDPATLARDLRRIPSLRLASVVAYDLFPQTAHVETLAVLEGR